MGNVHLRFPSVTQKRRLLNSLLCRFVMSSLPSLCIFELCLLITLPCSPKAELWRAQLNGMGIAKGAAQRDRPNAYETHIGLGWRSIIKTCSVELHMEDPFRTQMLLIWQVLSEMLGLFFELTWLLDGVSRRCFYSVNFLCSRGQSYRKICT